MPQPYQGHYRNSLDALSKRPNLAKHIGIIASLWANVEEELGLLLAEILNEDAHLAAIMFAPVKSEPARLSIVESVAQDRLPPKLVKEYQRLREKIKRTGAERDRVIHATWGLPENKSRSIILIDPRRTIIFFSILHAHFISSILTGEKPTIQQNKKRNARLAKLPPLFEYKNADFVQIQKNIKTRIKDIQSYRRKLEKRFFGPHNQLPLRKPPNPAP